MDFGIGQFNIKESMNKIGIFGGTFNPPHTEHIEIAKGCLKSGYDKLVLLIAKDPPHKPCGVSAKQRLDMLNIAIDGIDGVEICELELNDESARYTVDTLPKLKEIYKSFDFIIGGDSMVDLIKWRRPDEIIKLVNIAVVPRGERELLNDAIDYWTQKGANIKLLDFSVKEVSSTVCRHLCRIGFYDDLAVNVASYIDKKGLYGDLKNITEKLKYLVNDDTYEHIRRTAKYAIKLNEKLGLDYDQVIISALLHDCAKRYCREDHDFSLIPQDSVNTAVAHQFMGKVLAEQIFGVKDKEVLNAIERHCTATVDMSTLDKLIYCADMLEEGRDFDGVEKLRELIEKDFEEGFKQCLRASFEHLQNTGCIIYPLTLSAYKYYIGD